MKRVLGVALLAAVLWAPAGCHKKKGAEAAVEEGSRTATMVTLGDPKSAPQLVSGFYDIEGGAWRWAGKQFTVELGVPFGAGQKGAALELNFTVPDVVIAKSKTVTLAASVDGNALPPETYSQPGQYTYSRNIPPALLHAATAKVTFTLDKTIQPGGGDQRDLGIVAASIGLKGL